MARMIPYCLFLADTLMEILLLILKTVISAIIPRNPYTSRENARYVLFTVFLLSRLSLSFISSPISFLISWSISFSAFFATWISITAYCSIPVSFLKVSSEQRTVGISDELNGLSSSTAVTVSSFPLYQILSPSVSGLFLSKTTITQSLPSFTASISPDR